MIETTTITEGNRQMKGSQQSFTNRWFTYFDENNPQNSQNRLL